jgi:CMP/dCMP kinase
LYRTLAWLALGRGIPAEDEAGLGEVLGTHQIELRSLPAGASVTVDGAPVTIDLQQPEFSVFSSKIAGLPIVRKALLPVQREAFPGVPLVAEGRDMGTVVFPDAPVKFFVEVADTIRAGRRAAQLGIVPSDTPAIDNVLSEIRARDERDTTRALAPTVAAVGAVVVDNSSRSLTEVVDEMYHAVLARGIQLGR